MTPEELLAMKSALVGPPIVEVEVTGPDHEWAAMFVRKLVESRVVVCGSIEHAMVRSMYWWKDEVRDENEARVRFHTRQSLVGQVLAHTKENHPYEVPGFRWWRIEASPEYHQWVLDETSG